MKISRHQLLTSVLLVLIGIVVGIITVLLQEHYFTIADTRVQVAHIKVNTGDSVSHVETANMSPLMPNFKNVASRVTPTVVYIEASVPLSSVDMPKDKYHKFDDGFWDKFLPRKKVETVGSGVIFSPDGYILTNNHVVDHATDNEVQVALYDKRVFTGHIVGTDPSTDLAVVKVNAKNLPAIVIGNSDRIDVGDWVLAVGNPFRLRYTVTAGIVSALSRNVDIINDQMHIENFIQTDAAINRGNSGGALVNENGELVGINTAIATESGGYEGYGFAIPANLAIKIARDIIEFGHVERAYMGVQIGPVTNDRANDLGMKEIRGVEVLQAFKKGPAYEAGLRAHDVFLSVENVPVNAYNQLQAKIAERRPGDTVSVKVWRKHKILEFKIHLTGGDNKTIADWVKNVDGNSRSPNIEEPDSSGQNYLNSATFDLGFTVTALADPDNFNKFDLIITKVEARSEAQQRGLSQNDVILEVDGHKPKDLGDLKKSIGISLQKKGRILLKVEKDDGSTGYYELEN